MLGEPAAQQPFAEPVPDLELVRQAKGERRDLGVEIGRAALGAVRHQAAVELDQQIVRQPIGAIDRLRDLQGASAA